MSNQEVRIKLKSFDHKLLDQAARDISSAVKRTGADVCGPIPLPTAIRRYTINRSPHVNKKSREQFQFVFHKLKLILNEKNDNKTNLFIFLLKNSEFPGVEMEIILDYHSCLRYLQT